MINLANLIFLGFKTERNGLADTHQKIVVGKVNLRMEDIVGIEIKRKVKNIIENSLITEKNVLHI